MKILITGGTGSLGTALVEHWYDEHELTIYSRDPHKQQRLGTQYPKLRFILGDVCDQALTTWACAEQDALVHAAALKIIHLGETDRREYLRVNVEGTLSVIRGWKAHHPDFQLAAFISTDKSVEATNFYGTTKRMAEAFWADAGGSVIRYGNVVVSNGSFLEVWAKRIAEGKPVVVRRPSPTRFYLSLNEAVDLIESILKSPPAVYVPQCPRAFSVLDVANAMSATVVTELLGPGEKQHEKLLGHDEYLDTDEDTLTITRRVLKGWSPCPDRALYSSNTTYRMSGTEFIDAVEEGNK
ncbi:MAG: polysaccharide biosynthesis protein [Gammaproteobacteria bacterium]|nr:polysaccharide biosynthesis protein [Gammaproteobacteria bacterium]